MTPYQIGIVYNTQDEDSCAVAAFYLSEHKCPFINLLPVTFARKKIIPASEFAAVKAQLDTLLKTRPHIQALAVCWVEPWRVHPDEDTSVGMSITSALTFGWGNQWYNDTGGLPYDLTATSPLYDKNLSQPYTDFGYRPAILVAGATAADAYELIERAVDCTGLCPVGTAYLYRTTDDARSVREYQMLQAKTFWDEEEPGFVSFFDNDNGDPDLNCLRDASDVMFYFTGIKSVEHLDTLTFRPGAVGDHLTSYGGKLTGNNGQMSALRWLEAGCVGSYGTVSEPGNTPDKFPDVHKFVLRYKAGLPLIAAYWASVKRPGEGVFLGDPLASPFAN